MRAGWKTMKLGDACFVDYGTRVVRNKDGGTIFPVYGGGGATFQMDIYNRENCLVVARFAMSQTCTRFVQGKFFLNDSGLTLRAKDKDLSQQFLDWIIISKNDLIYSFGKGSAQKNMDMEDFRNMEISFPVSLPEQQRIVDILDREFAKIDALKANAEKSLQAAKDLFQATLKKELEPKERWEELAIPEVSENLDSKRVPITKSVRENGKYPYYGASGIVDYVADYIFDEPLLLVSEDGANLLARSTPIAFSIEGKVWVNNHSHVLRFDDYKKQKFVEYWFAGNDISSLITGTAQPKFNQKALNSIKIAFPVKEQEMEDILDRLGEMEDKSNTLQENYQKTLTLCDDLKQSLLRQAFNGEL